MMVRIVLSNVFPRNTTRIQGSCQHLEVRYPMRNHLERRRKCMKPTSVFKRFLCAVLVVAMMVGNVIPAYAIDTHTHAEEDHVSHQRG